MLRRQGCALGILSVGLLCGNFAAPVLGVPYASQVRNTTGATWEFVLNEAADSITVKRDGANPFVIPAPTAGRQTFDMTGFSTFEIEVNKNTSSGNWTLISDPNNAFTRFERPRGIAINKIPTSPYFGTVYVTNPRTNATASGRAMGDGIYANSADMKGVDLANNFAVVADPNDTTQAKAPGFTVSGSASSSPWKIALDEAGNVIVSDWADASGGIKWASPDLRFGGLILKTESGPTGGVPSDVSDEFGPIPLHGSIVSQVTVTGSVGNNLVVTALDEDLDAQLSSPGNDGNSLWRWNVGAARSSTKPGEESLQAYGINPTLVIDSTTLGPDTATPSASNFLALNVGVLADAIYNPTYNKWYFTQNRSAGGEGGLTIITPGATATTPVVNWNSRSTTATLGLDGNTTAADIQDILRNSGTIAFSADGTKMYLHRIAVDTDNPVLGQTSNLPGAILEIPLDAAGLPVITVNAGQITNWKSITIASNNTAHTSAEVEFDAAGNMYTITNAGERVEVWSPGGNKRAITRSNGTFEVQTVTVAPIAGDYNGNGTVGPEDYTLWAENFGEPVSSAGLVNLNPAKIETVIDASDYTFWRDLLPAPAAAAAVPEPATGLLALVGLAGLTLAAKRRR
jgi:hypothetical protein